MRYSKGNSGFVHGYRSGLEELVAEQLKKAGVNAGYETEKFAYVKPARNAKYTPDFILPNGIVIETKGRFITDDRHKHILLKKTYPDLDIRFVFSNSRTRISKNSKTTYAMWCEKQGFPFADKLIPKDWLEETPCKKRIAAIEAAKVKT